MLRADCDFENWRGGGTAEGEVMGHLLRIMEFVGYRVVVFYGDGGVEGVGFVD